MTSERSAKMRLIQQDGSIIVEPSVDDVLSLMNRMIGVDGQEELLLYFSEKEVLDLDHSIILHLILAHHHGAGNSKWVVEFSTAEDPDTWLVLADHLPSGNIFEIRTRVGVVEKVRAECLLSSSLLLRRAIEWFLKYHTTCPDLIWLDHSEAVHDEDNAPNY